MAILKILLLLILVSSYPVLVHCNQRGSVKYLTSLNEELSIHYVLPRREIFKSDAFPAIFLFHGGGWRRGSFKQFQKYCEAFAQSGVACFMPEYIAEKSTSSGPLQAISNAVNSVKYLLSQSHRFNLKDSSIAIGGASAGGQIAAAIALNVPYVRGIAGREYKFSKAILISPVLDNGSEGFGYKEFQDRWRELSPFHNVSRTSTSYLVLSGSADKLIPAKTLLGFCGKLKEAGDNCVLKQVRGAEHGFLNFKDGKNPHYYWVEKEAKNFLTDWRPGRD